MLKMIDIGDNKGCSINIDYYVPFNIDIKHQKKIIENKIYWIAGNAEDTLLEIGVGEKSGELMSVTLTAATNVVTKEIIISSKKIIEGNPIFEISNFKHQFNEKQKNFQVILTENYILISFDLIFKIETIVKINRMEIGFGISNNLSLIKINDLTQKEYIDLRDSFKL